VGSPIEICPAEQACTWRVTGRRAVLPRLFDDSSEIQPKVLKYHPRGISSWCHRDTWSGMAARAAEINVGHRGSVFTELGNRAQRAILIGEKRSLSERTSDRADDFARNVDRRMGYTFQDFGLQVGNVLGSNEVNEVISVRLTRLCPGTSANSSSRVAGDYIGTLRTTNFMSACPAGARLGSMAESFQLTIIGACGRCPPRHCRYTFARKSSDSSVR
jgi:hypothetical protein